MAEKDKKVGADKNGKKIEYVVVNVDPVFKEDERKKTYKQIERTLFDVFKKYFPPRA